MHLRFAGEERSARQPIRPERSAQPVRFPPTESSLLLILCLDIFLNRNIFRLMTRRVYPVNVFSAIAEPRRREVIALLANGGEHAVNEIVLGMKMAQPAVSKHLGALRKAGVVTVVKRGQHRMYRLNAEGLKPVHEWVKAFERHWNRQVSQIKQRSERKALERLIRVENGPLQTEEG